jgi:hypothetical protein
LAVSITIGTLDARELRQHEVEQDEVRSVGPEAGERGPPVGRLDDLESLRLQSVRERLAECRLVFHDEDRSCHSGQGYEPVLTHRWRRARAETG